MEDDDEDVVFQNSALYDHLVSSGYEEFESASHLSHVGKQQSTRPATTDQYKLRPVTGCVRRVAEWLGVWSVPNAPAVRLLLHAGLLTERDHAVAAELSCGAEKHALEYSAATPPTAGAVLYGAVAVACVASAIYLPWLRLPAALVAVVIGGAAAAAAARGRAAAAARRRVQQFCRGALQLRRTAQRAVRQLQEAHLMTRGLALSLGDGGGERSGAQAAAAAFVAQYGPLLQASGGSLRSSCAAIAATTRTLRRRCPLLDGVDPAPQYVAYDEVALSGGQISEVTVKDVKLLGQLLVELLSELVRRCCLSWCEDLLPAGASSQHELVTGLLASLTVVLDEQQRRLSAAQRAHAARWEQPAAAAPAAGSAPAVAPMLAARPLYVSVHSICLQAQVAALRARACEHLLVGQAEVEPDGGGDAAPADVAADAAVRSRLYSQLAELRSRLESAVLLCDQTQLQLSQLDEQPASERAAAGVQALLQSPLAAAPLLELPEPEIADQFFEAVVEGGDAPPSEDEDPLSREERIQRRLQRERARELVRELDGALGAKRREWRLREAVARGEPPPDDATDLSAQSSDVSLSPMMVAAAARRTPDSSSVTAPPARGTGTVNRNIPDDYKVDLADLNRFSDLSESEGDGAEIGGAALPPSNDLNHLLPVRRRARPAAGRRLPSRPSSVAGAPLIITAAAGHQQSRRTFSVIAPAAADPLDTDGDTGRPADPQAGYEPSRRSAASLGLPARLGFPTELSAQAAAVAQLRRRQQTAADEETFGSDSD